MDISRRSWHYKFNMFFDCWEKERSLCTYFWATVIRIIFTLFLSAIGIGLIGAVVTALFSPGGIFFLSGLITVGSMFIIPPWVIHKLRKLGWTNDPECVNILTEYIRAKKSKLCPMIKFVR